jgi:outer membrane protein insertion porin family
MISRARYRLTALILGLLASWCAWSFDAFVIRDIRVEGLERISLGTVLNYLPVNVGETLDASRTAVTIRTLFKTGFFNDIRLRADGDVLVVVVEERPAIATIKINGNKDITTDQLNEALKAIGLSEGSIFDRSSLEKMTLELERQYFGQGKYGIKVQTTVTDLADNRVDIVIDIDEGGVARIRRINVIGNQAYSDAELLDAFVLSPRTMFAFFSDSDQYSSRKLSGDLEALRSHYLDNGYINFSIDSTEVSITPDKSDVYITINVTEGEKYTIAGVQLAGDLIVPEDELRKLVNIRAGDVFSRKAATQGAAAISERLGKEGYAFSNVNPSPKVDKERREVELVFFVDPGRRIYVRRVNVAGNTKTQDEVIRREVRQMEGGWISTDKVNLSRTRLNRLGYFEEASVETPAVPGVADQVDVNFAVKERPSGSLTAGVGYSQSQGFLVNASISQNNVFGTGKRVSATVNNSSVNRTYSFSYTNPYYTLDGISRGFSIFSRETDPSDTSVVDYTTDVKGVSVDYGFPLSEFNTANLSLGYENTSIDTTDSTPQSILDFIAENDDQFDIYKVTGGFTHDTRNRAILASLGVLHNISTEVALPGSGLEYYKLRYRTLKYLPLYEDFTLLLKGDLGYGDGYADTSGLPFFENFYAGGPESVRGYSSNSLGPQEDGDARGGAFKTVGNIEFIFPLPFAADNKSLRVSTFFDIGNVFADVDDFDSGELRQSLGVSVLWFTPIAPMTFSLAWPLNDEPGDDTERFQFTLGSFFF